jgi:hypothetical protein
MTNDSIPCTLVPKIDGKLREQITIRNVLNPNEVHMISLKGTVIRRYNFLIDPAELSFGEVTAGSSSKGALVFITNTSSSENEITLSHVQKDFLVCKPLVSYQLKNMNSRRLTESMHVQVEKLGCKLRCLIRKKKFEYAAKVQQLIDTYSRTTFDTTPAQLRQMDAKYMDRMTFRVAPLQMVCIECQLIPSVLVGKRLTIESRVDGAILVYERGRSETQKMIRYQAHVAPEAQRLLDSTVQRTVVVEPTAVTLDHVFIHECTTITLRIRNVSNTQQTYWISSDSGNDCIVSSPNKEGQVNRQEQQDLPVDVYCLLPGSITKHLTITTQTTTQTVVFQITSEYRQILEFPGLPDTRTIDFGSIMLTSLQAVEERSSFMIANVTDSPFHVCIVNDRPKEVLVYEQDPEVPQVRPFALPGRSSVRMNILLQPEIDLYAYRKYRASIIAATITIMAFETEEEAQEMQSVPCIFASQISVKAIVGLIGISSSDPKIDSGSVSGSVLEAVVVVKNKSSHIGLDFVCSCSEGLSVEPESFTLLGHVFQQSQQELTVRFRPSTAGINEAKLQLLLSGAVSYTKTIEVVAFVDPKVIETNLPKNAKNIDYLAIGSLYVVNGRPVGRSLNLQLTNISATSVSLQLMSRKVLVSRQRSVQWTFNFPMSDAFYNPAEPKFSHRMFVKSATTSRILKVIDIVGEFVVSIAALTTDTIALGRFGRINNWHCGTRTIGIVNKSNIDLSLAVTCHLCDRQPIVIGS